jgi:Flp pilus assembly protein TadG
MNQSRRRRARRDRGVAATELALILPLLITIVLACVDFGRFGAAYIAITNAVRAGAGIGSNTKVTTASLGAWRTAIRSAVNNEFVGQSGVDPARLTVLDPQWLAPEASGLRRVQVSVEYNFQMLVPWPGLPNQVTLRRTVEMRMLN